MYVQPKSTVLFYYSQSGNSLDVARRIAKQLEASGASGVEPVKLVSMARAVYDDAYQYSDFEQVGFVVPLYFLGLPRTVEVFLKNLQLDGHPYVFSVVTQALTKGHPFGQIEGLLKEKGLSLSYGSYLTFPDSYIRWMEGPEPQRMSAILEAAYEKLPRIVEVIANQGCEIEGITLWNKAMTAVVYPLWRNTLKGRGPQIQVSDACVQCGICKRTCPTQNIKLDEHGPKWSNKCEDCMACVQHCPTKAIYLNATTFKKRRYRNPSVELSDLLL